MRSIVYKLLAKLREKRYYHGPLAQTVPPNANLSGSDIFKKYILISVFIAIRLLRWRQ